MEIILMTVKAEQLVLSFTNITTPINVTVKHRKIIILITLSLLLCKSVYAFATHCVLPSIAWK